MTLEIEKLKIVDIPINNIITNPVQPRDNFEQEEIEGLSKTIKKIGLAQPITVFALENGNYQIVAGERRWRASKIANFETITAILVSNNPEKNSVISLIENVQRKDLTSIEKARGYREIMKSRNIILSMKDTLSSLHRVKEFVYRGENKELNEIDIKLNEINNMIGKSSNTIINWIQSINLENEIIESEMRDTKKLSGIILSRLSTIEDKELQVKTYEKIKDDKNSLSISPSKFITKIKKVDKETQDRILQNQVDFDDLGDKEESYDDFELENENKLEEEFQFKTASSVSEPEDINESTTMNVQSSVPIKKHVDKIPNNQLYIERIMWNRKIFEKLIKFYTTGTDGKKIHDFESIITTIDKRELMIVDIRNTPFSRFKPEFNKGRLQEFAQEKGIEYIHIPELGINKKLRNKLFSEEITEQELWDIYKKDIFTNDLKDKITQILKEHIPIFMCTEISPERCHRHVIAEWLLNQKEIGYDL